MQLKQTNKLTNKQFVCAAFPLFLLSIFPEFKWPTFSISLSLAVRRK